jgi:hypothetical protein
MAVEANHTIVIMGSVEIELEFRSIAFESTVGVFSLIPKKNATISTLLEWDTVYVYNLNANLFKNMYDLKKYRIQL